MEVFVLEVFGLRFGGLRFGGLRFGGLRFGGLRSSFWTHPTRCTFSARSCKRGSCLIDKEKDCTEAIARGGWGWALYGGYGLDSSPEQI